MKRRLPRSRALLLAPLALAAALIAGYLWGSRPQPVPAPVLDEPLQLRLERSLTSTRP
jgi:hypothetical protein